MKERGRLWFLAKSGGRRRVWFPVKRRPVFFLIVYIVLFFLIRSHIRMFCYPLKNWKHIGSHWSSLVSSPNLYLLLMKYEKQVLKQKRRDCIRFVANFNLSKEEIGFVRETLSPTCEDAFFDYLEGIDYSDVEVYAIAEGSVVFPKIPLMRVEGPMAGPDGGKPVDHLEKYLEYSFVEHISMLLLANSWDLMKL
ncbi:hypothetical protein L1887_24028 [Cichorium endivia]|nr:hypothetical protein L1887_24028 [Cichorium endivia]